MTNRVRRKIQKLRAIPFSNPSLTGRTSGIRTPRSITRAGYRLLSSPTVSLLSTRPSAPSTAPSLKTCRSEPKARVTAGSIWMVKGCRECWLSIPAAGTTSPTSGTAGSDPCVRWLLNLRWPLPRAAATSSWTLPVMATSIVVDFGGPAPGFYERDRDEGWKRHVPFASLPNIDWQDPNLRFVDLTGDGLADALDHRRRSIHLVSAPSMSVVSQLRSGLASR